MGTDEQKKEELWNQMKRVRKYGFWIVIIVLTLLTIRDVIDLVRFILF